jgi:hypothetical protein
MDKDKFKKHIESVAVIKDGSSRLNKSKPKIRIIKEIDEFGEEIELEIEDSDYNPTVSLELVKLKDNFKLCELGCGEIVNNQIIEKKFYFSPAKHWRTRCVNCKSVVAPDGNGFLESNTAPSIFYHYFLKKNK